MQALGADAQEARVTRSYLFVPADSERKFASALRTSADAIILDLEDSVAPGQKAAARDNLPEFLAAQTNAELWVRVNPVDSPECVLDVSALGSAPPHGVMLPKARGANDIRSLDSLLKDMEGKAKVAAGTTRVLPLVTETPAALFAVQEYVAVKERLVGLTWGAEDLAAAIGAQANKDAEGRWLDVFSMARSLCLIAAAAADLPAIETVFTSVRDVDGVSEFANAARRDGFSGMLVLHPAQIEPVNNAFTPTSEEIERARQIVELFDASADAGVAVIDGQMVDRPHYLQARRLLGVADRLAAR